MSRLSDRERAVLRELSGELPGGLRPYAVVARRAGLEEREVIDTVHALVARGVVRRVGAILHHRRLGYDANAMVAWRVPEDALERAGRAAALRPETSHVYERATSPAWPYNLYTMIHARSRDEIAAVVELLARDIGARDRRVLFTLREFTKRPPPYPILHEGRARGRLPRDGRGVARPVSEEGDE